MKSNCEYKHIPDNEIVLQDENDILGTRPYVEALSQIIKDCDPSLTIGLMGGWGTGKSSIVKTLQAKFNNETNSNIKVFIYDAWKYSKDSFRRTFIMELSEYFKVPTKDMSKGFYKDENKEVEVRIGFSKGLWWLYLMIFLPAIVVITLIMYLNIANGIRAIISLFAIVNSLLILLFKNSLVKYNTFVVTPHLFAPEQFEKVFKDKISKIVKKEKLKKIVIVIDNIDRCHKERAVELLLAIKNFLETEKTIFIVPIDKKTVIEYFISSQDDPTTSQENANEFFRKIFNTTITIKEFSGRELFNFCNELNKKYKLGLPDEVAFLVSKGFPKNPRRIIQFLNTFQAEVLFAKKQEEIGNLEKGIVSGNIPMLAKLNIIREEWPDFYSLIVKDPDLLNAVNEAVNEVIRKK